MKARTKRILLFFTCIFTFIGLQWLSAIPFTRGIAEAYFALWAITISAWVASYPFIENDL